jgi:hypothetical protein
MEFWLEHDIRAIGNLLGCSILVDNSFIDSLKCLMARVLVDLNLSMGIFESIDLILGKQFYT